MMEQKKDRLAKLAELTKGRKSAWIKEAEQRSKNEKTSKRSELIALGILRTLRSNKACGQAPTSQKELAEMMNVSPQLVNKWVKGNENFTLETIERLEEALKTIFIHVITPKSRKTEERVLYKTISYIRTQSSLRTGVRNRPVEVSFENVNQKVNVWISDIPYPC